MSLHGFIILTWVTLAVVFLTSRTHAFVPLRIDGRLAKPIARTTWSPYTDSSPIVTKCIALDDDLPPTSKKAGKKRQKVIDLWKSGRKLDKQIQLLTLPAIVNFAIIPLVGAVDTYWVGRMKQALALAGQGAANQIFTSAFWMISFLPSVLTPLIATHAGKDDKESVQDRVGEGLFVGMIFGLLGSLSLLFFPHLALSLVLPPDAPARAFADPYLRIRAFSFAPAVLSTVAFAAFRGTMDVVTPLQVSFWSNLVNVVLDPVLVFKMNLGVSGAAFATVLSELVGVVMYGYKLFKHRMTTVDKIFRKHNLQNMKPLVVGGLSMQLRSAAINVAMLSVSRRTQALDSSGVAAAAHVITYQMWALANVALLALSSVATVVVPTEIARVQKSGERGSTFVGRFTANRMMSWGVLGGLVMACLQMACLPLLSLFSPLKEVQEVARVPSIIASFLHVINGLVFVGEGVQQGNQCFISLAIVTVLASMGMMTSLHFFGTSLVGVWASFGVFQMTRLVGVARHHYFSGPLSPRAIMLEAAEEAAMAQALTNRTDTKEGEMLIAD